MAAGCAEASRAPVPRDGVTNEDDEDPQSGDGDSSYGDGDDGNEFGDGDSSGPVDGGAGTDFGSILCGLIGGCDGGVMPPAPTDAAISDDPNDTIVPGREPDPSNAPECPKHAPENPVGDCLGKPIYVQCGYTTYHCICDWYHWLCI